MPAKQQKGIISGATATPATPQVGASDRQNSIAAKPIKPATVAPTSKSVPASAMTKSPASARTAMPQPNVQAIEGIRTALREKLMTTSTIGVPNPGMGITR